MSHMEFTEDLFNPKDQLDESTGTTAAAPLIRKGKVFNFISIDFCLHAFYFKKKKKM